MGHRRTSCEGKAAVFDAGYSARGPVCMSVCSSSRASGAPCAVLGRVERCVLLQHAAGGEGEGGGGTHERVRRLGHIRWPHHERNVPGRRGRGVGRGAHTHVSGGRGPRFRRLPWLVGGWVGVGAGCGGADVRESSVTATHTSYTSGSRGDSHTMCCMYLIRVLLNPFTRLLDSKAE